MPLQLHCLFKYSHMTCFTPLLKWRACLPARYSCQFSIGLCGKDSYFTGKDPCSSPPSSTWITTTLSTKNCLKPPILGFNTAYLHPFSDPVQVTTVKFHLWVRVCVFSPFLLKITPFCCRKSVKSGKEKREKLRREKTEKGKQKQGSRSVCKAFSCYKVMPLVAPNLIAA